MSYTVDQMITYYNFIKAKERARLTGEKLISCQQEYRKLSEEAEAHKQAKYAALEAKEGKAKVAVLKLQDRYATTQAKKNAAP